MMNTIYRGGPLVLLASTTMLIACGRDNGETTTTSADVRQEAQELAQTLGEFGETQRERAVATLEQGLADIDRRIADLEAEVRRASGDARSAMEDTIEALRAQRDDVADRLTNLRASGEDAWQKARDGAVEAYQALAKAVSDASEQF